MENENFDMYRVVVLPKLSGRDEPSVWHPSRMTAERWADFFALKGYPVAVECGRTGKLNKWTPLGYVAIN
jgi:hypothetical protein